MQKKNKMKKNIMHKKHKYFKMKLLTKHLHNNDEMHTLNSIVIQKRQQQRFCHCMQTQLYLFNLFNNEILSFYISFSLSQAADKSLLTDLIENAYLMIITAMLTSQNTVFKM